MRSKLFRRRFLQRKFTSSFKLNPKLTRNRIARLLSGIVGLFTAISILPLVSVMSFIFIRGYDKLSLKLLTELPPAAGFDGGGIGNAIMGTITITTIASMLSIPIGVGGGIYIAELIKEGFFTEMIKFGSRVLSGIPSIIYGICIYETVVATRLFFDKSYGAVAGGICLGLIMIPSVFQTTYSASRAVPSEYREIAIGLGGSESATIKNIVLPTALKKITTGITLAISRAAGETAPLVFTALFSPFWPEGLFNPIATMSVLIYNFSSAPYKSQNDLAWAASFVLMMLILVANLFARWIVYLLNRPISPK
uniref:Putative phosphate ABC transporter n=1 Tax=Paulinella chromatophora TaxID=39717 RepID=B1X3U4_PAUCH|nr:putative phosphate ABC transporter [Paulinella chromatophora]ACB42613.1 putative phosphate ABC transporter [Paulinella chromatophora]